MVCFVYTIFQTNDHFDCFINYKYSEKSAIKSLKHRYERHLAEDKERNSRNTNLLRMLERIDYQAATLAAKTEKLKLLKVNEKLIF